MSGQKKWLVTFREVQTCTISVVAETKEEARDNAENDYMGARGFGSWDFEEPEVINIQENGAADEYDKNEPEEGIVDVPDY